MSFLRLSILSLLLSVGNVYAQEDAASTSSGEVEEITVTGSQIKGAKITGSLPVSVIAFEDIEALGIDSGEELLENIAENGMNLFNEAENASGGVNAARGDMGAYNLRNMGTGNTLTLLNGRRLVNSPGYQTELIGGDYVPAITVNSNLVPVWGIERMEILRDGASAFMVLMLSLVLLTMRCKKISKGLPLELNTVGTIILMQKIKPLLQNLVKTLITVPLM